MDAQTMTYVLLGVATVGAIILILVTIADRKYIADLRGRNENQRELLAAERRASEAHTSFGDAMLDLAESRGQTLGILREINRLLTLDNEALMGKAVPVADEVEIVPAAAPEEPKEAKPHPIDVECPKCNARPGLQCWTAGHRPANTAHVQRKQRANGIIQ